MGKLLGMLKFKTLCMATISTKNLSSMWNGNEALLIEGLKDLEERNILRKIISDGEEKNIYQLSDVKDWKLS